jgi:hypothetical protein
MDIMEIGVDEASWIQLAQDRFQWRACEHGNEPSGSIRKHDIFLTISVSINIMHHGVSE